MTKMSTSALIAVFTCQALLCTSARGAEESQPPAAPPPPVEAADVISPERLEQMVSPVALYPDSLLMQILMAATYPLEVVEADRWVKKNPDVKDDALDKMLVEKKWDPSVKSLTHFPTVLSRMSENLDWSKDLGDAFLAQQKDVLQAIQRMRWKAHELGNLKSSPEQKVIVEAAPPSTTVVVQQAPPQVIRIEPAQPQVVYVPAYNPAVIYGPPPATVYYPTMYAYPPGYVATASLLSFGAGMAVGAALWGNCNWGSGDVQVNNNYNVNSGNSNVNNGNINRGNTNNANRAKTEQWKHNPQHRKGVNYPNNAVGQRYGQNGAANRAALNDARGYGGAAAQTRPTGAATGTRAAATTNAPKAATGAAKNTRAAGNTGANRPASTSRSSSQSSRPATPHQQPSNSRGTAFGDGGNGRSERAASSRGASSRGVDRGSFARDTGGSAGGGGRAGGSGRSGGGGGGGGGRGGGGGGGGRRR